MTKQLLLKNGGVMLTRTESEYKKNKYKKNMTTEECQHNGISEKEILGKYRGTQKQEISHTPTENRYTRCKAMIILRATTITLNMKRIHSTTRELLPWSKF